MRRYRFAAVNLISGFLKNCLHLIRMCCFLPQRRCLFVSVFPGDWVLMRRVVRIKIRLIDYYHYLKATL